MRAVPSTGPLSAVCAHLAQAVALGSDELTYRRLRLILRGLAWLVVTVIAETNTEADCQNAYLYFLEQLARERAAPR